MPEGRRWSGLLKRTTDRPKSWCTIPSQRLQSQSREQPSKTKERKQGAERIKLLWLFSSSQGESWQQQGVLSEQIRGAADCKWCSVFVMGPCQRLSIFLNLVHPCTVLKFSEGAWVMLRSYHGEVTIIYQMQTNKYHWGQHPSGNYSQACGSFLIAEIYPTRSYIIKRMCVTKSQLEMFVYT